MATIIQKIEKKKLKAQTNLVCSNQANAEGLLIAKNFGYETKFISPKKFTSREKFDDELAKILKLKKTDWVVCAGYMRILQAPMLNAFKNRIINIHPSLLPAFPGLKAQKQALEYGVKFTGCTVHFVDQGIDTGKIISQRVVPIKKGDTETILTKRILKEEHDLYWRTLKQIL